MLYLQARVKLHGRISPCRLMRLLCVSLVAIEYLQYFIVHKIRPLSPVRLTLQLHFVQHFDVHLKKHILRATVWKLFINNYVTRDFPHTYKRTIKNYTATSCLPKCTFKPNCWSVLRDQENVSLRCCIVLAVHMQATLSYR